MALISCLGSMGVNLDDNTAYSVGYTTSDKSVLTNGAATVSVSGQQAFIINIKGKGYTNMALAAQSGTMNLSWVGIKADGTVGSVTGCNNAGSYPTNNVSDYDLILINGNSLTTAQAITFTFT